MEQPDFDFSDSDTPSPGGDSPRSDWDEVPQARFLSWSRAEQLLYCAARDADEACHCQPEDAAWYLERARQYQDDARTLIDER